jgi:hypothetical protein
MLITKQAHATVGPSLRLDLERRCDRVLILVMEMIAVVVTMICCYHSTLLLLHSAHFESAPTEAFVPLNLRASSSGRLLQQLQERRIRILRQQARSTTTLAAGLREEASPVKT